MMAPGSGGGARDGDGAKVHNTPHHLDKEISYLCDRLGWNIELMLTQGRGRHTRHPQLYSRVGSVRLQTHVR